MKTITLLGVIAVVTLITIWSNKRDDKLVEVYKDVEPCMVDSRLPACE